jgi:hypothetical protein
VWSVAQTAMSYGGLVESTGSSHSINVLVPSDCVKIDGLVNKNRQNREENKTFLGR